MGAGLFVLKLVQAAVITAEEDPAVRASGNTLGYDTVSGAAEARDLHRLAVKDGVRRAGAGAAEAKPEKGGINGSADNKEMRGAIRQAERFGRLSGANGNDHLLAGRVRGFRVDFAGYPEEKVGVDRGPGTSDR
jgi:hypothetical protein